tara:strand:- start:28 stop:444 length:417 start_codon:yes stop_codon:yes gene_type:complete
MADGYALATQVGVLAALKANSGVTSLVSNRIYDEPPQDVVFPYLRFNTIQPNAFDTDTAQGALVDISLEAHSRSASGRVEATSIAEAVQAALHRQEASVSVAGYTLVELIFEAISVTRDSEGRGFTAIISLQAMLDTA